MGPTLRLAGMSDTTARLADFPGRGELEAQLRMLLPSGWEAAIRDASDDSLTRLKGLIDNPTVVAALGRAGWVAPHFAPEHGGRGLSRSDARDALSLLVAWEVPHVPRGSGLPLAAPTIEQWSSDETKRLLLPKIMTGEHRWCQLFSEPGAGSEWHRWRQQRSTTVTSGS